MASRGKSESARSYGITIATNDPKKMWKRILTRVIVPSRYPHELPLTILGILEDFWALCNIGEGDGLVHVFCGRWPSYKKLTLEFLNTLKVHRNRRSRIRERIEFRLVTCVISYTTVSPMMMRRLSVIAPRFGLPLPTRVKPRSLSQGRGSQHRSATPLKVRSLTRLCRCMCVNWLGGYVDLVVSLGLCLSSLSKISTHFYWVV